MDFLKKLFQHFSKNKVSQNYRQILKEKYSHFKNLLNANNQILKTIAELEEKKATGKPFDRKYLILKTNEILSNTEKIIFHLNALSQNKYSSLYQTYQTLKEQIESLLYPKLEIVKTEFVYPLTEITRANVNCAGRKMANLGELKNVLKLPTPEGFVLTTSAFLYFIKQNRLEEKINSLLVKAYNTEDLKTLEKLSSDLQALVLESKVPENLEAFIFKAYDRLVKQIGYLPKLAVRSSAVLEDTELTFGGQFSSFLDVTKEELIEKYKEVIASLFNTHALFGYRSKGVPKDFLVMAVGFLCMVEAKVSGVAYSIDPNNPAGDYLLITAVKGKGDVLVSGLTSAETYLVQKSSLKILEVKTSNHSSPLLTEEEIFDLAEKTLKLEKHFQTPRDIEWSIDQQGKLYFLQTRRLKLNQELNWETKLTFNPEGYKVLLEGGTIASKGVGYGKAFLLEEDKNLTDFKKGEVLIVRHTRPQYAVVMEKASAVVTDIGSPTGHMASIAREYGVPMIVNTKIATQILKPGQEITVDAIHGKIYEGKVEELLNEYQRLKNLGFKNSSLYHSLTELLKLITPLNLTLPSHSDFKLENCRTIHDITRFAHEMAMQEFFSLGETYQNKDLEPSVLQIGLPIQILILDIEDGLKDPQKKHITLEDIQSKPLLAVLKGMLNIKWPEPPPIDAKGFLGLIFTTTITPEEELLAMGEKSFCIITQNYLNLSIRMGYHFSIIETYIGENINDNYIKFFFKGGGAEGLRRLRRLKIFEEVLKRLGFCVKIEEDVLEARLTKYEEREILETLEVLGKLTAYTKQLDVALYADLITQKYIEDFIKDHLPKQ
ncbi:hypothetical protein F1847_08025 [Thermodesulfobacterium sp. TA1]|uniref:PEP/pyruvate-binding domain-containing protein n=1 Tax=Thermodesulfobacterium sp. TA1 TaxID=2234087 RepID=UPI001231D1CA|nr:PEP/pyruvate-binding domain-containing protein [Thermodesulfobacterium sp. TA1]QER42689.1 hypothetical protein F1847_08025 [Thermodesulfobacterium sp. TA1]